MDKDERYLLIEVSVLYYLENLTQSEIAKKLFISRSKVSRLLKKARDEGIVDVNINYNCDEITQLKNEVVRRFNVSDIAVVKTLSHYDDTIKELGKVAANILYDDIHDGVTIGISWGRSVSSAVNHLREKQVKDVKVVELFGAIGNDLNETDMLSIGSTLSKKINGKFYHLAAPLYISDKNTRDVMINTPIIRNTLEKINECSFILSGIGAIDSDIPQQIWDHYLEDDVKSRIVSSGGVGFLCAHFFNEAGAFLKFDINDSIIGIPVERIKQKRIICVAGGVNKVRAIRSALLGGYIHTLIIDDQTLKDIIALDDKLKAL